MPNEIRPSKPVTALDELHAKLEGCTEQARVIQNVADSEKRSLNEAEIAQMENINAVFDSVEREIRVRKATEEMEARLAAPARRQTQPADVDTSQQNGTPPPRPGATSSTRPHISGGDYVGASKGTCGFRSLGEFAIAAAQFATRPDPRILNAPATFGSEGTNADGGFAVPPDFRDTIMKTVMGETSLLARTDQMVTSSNRITIPVDNTTPWQTSGGVLVSWVAEGADKPPSKPALAQVNINVNKAAALIPLTDELLEDVPAMTRYLTTKVPEKFTSLFNAAIVNGDGSGKPLGLLQSPAKVTVAAVSGQGAGTIVAKNILAMWGRLYSEYRNDAVWIVNHDAEAQLQQLVMPGTNPSFPAYMPPGGFSQSPYSTLLGRPILVVETASALGTEGDIILTSLKEYISVIKAGGMKTDVSIHLYFNSDITAFRFVMRMGGQPKLSAAMTRLNGSNTLSSIVTLNSTRT